MIASNGDARAEAKRRVRAKLAAYNAMPAAERVANILHATHTHAAAETLLNEICAEVLAPIQDVLTRWEGSDVAYSNFAREIREALYAARTETPKAVTR